MSLIVFLTRAFAGLFMLIFVGISLDPTISKTNPEWHANSAATAASLFLTILYVWPLVVDAKNKKIVTRMPTAKSFTVTRFMTFGRWGFALLESILTADLFLQFHFKFGILSLILVACMVPPVDRLLFAPDRELSYRLKKDGTFLKVLSNLGAVVGFFSYFFFAQNEYTISINLLLISIGLFLVTPIALLAKGGWQALSLKYTMPPPVVPDRPVQTIIQKPPAVLQNQPAETIISKADAIQKAPAVVPDQIIDPVIRKADTKQKLPALRKPHNDSPGQTTSPGNPTKKRKYHSAKAWVWNWPIPKEYQDYPIRETGFNMLIKGFEASYLESKDYHQRLAMHRDKPAFIKEFIVQVEEYIELMRLRYDLQVRNKVMGVGSGSVGFVPDEISKVWKANRNLRSLYQATKWYAEAPNKQSVLPFRSIAPHVAEYRAMMNLVRHLRHRLSKMSKTTKPHSKKITNITNTPMETEGITPIVFISYSWDSPEHEAWVINLATLLRENGVDAILDKWDLGLLGNLLPHFMETSISRSHRVICIMTPNYKKKTENLTGGVGYEYSIITSQIFTETINTSKFIPLFRNGTAENAIPTALKGRRYVDMRDDTQFDEKFVHELLRDIHNEPKFKKPAIGKKTKF